MKCASPVPIGVAYTAVRPCGQCMGCRINRRRLKTARYLLEGLQHDITTFSTYTFAPKHAPEGNCFGSVERSTARGLLKRARYHHGTGVRYAIVGEYGERFLRPHYHALWFGLSPEEVEDVSSHVWPYGASKHGAATGQALAYVAGYQEKKWTKYLPPELEGNEPEFSICSLKPGIGSPSLDWLEEIHYSRGVAKLMSETGDVARVFRLGGKIWPLDRYIRLKLRERLGMKESNPVREASPRGEVVPYELFPHPDLPDIECSRPSAEWRDRLWRARLTSEKLDRQARRRSERFSDAQTQETA